MALAPRHHCCPPFFSSPARPRSPDTPACRSEGTPPAAPRAQLAALCNPRQLQHGSAGAGIGLRRRCYALSSAGCLCRSLPTAQVCTACSVRLCYTQVAPGKGAAWFAPQHKAKRVAAWRRARRPEVGRGMRSAWAGFKQANACGGKSDRDGRAVRQQAGTRVHGGEARAGFEQEISVKRGDGAPLTRVCLAGLGEGLVCLFGGSTVNDPLLLE